MSGWAKQSTCLGGHFDEKTVFRREDRVQQRALPSNRNRIQISVEVNLCAYTENLEEIPNFKIFPECFRGHWEYYGDHMWSAGRL